MIGKLLRRSIDSAVNAAMDDRLSREVLLTRERPSKWDDMRELAALQMQGATWKQRMNEMWIDGVPMNVGGGLMGLEVNPSSANYSTITIGATELSLWGTSLGPTIVPFTTFRQGSTGYMLRCFGNATSAATPGTQTFNPRLTNVTGASLGISGTFTPIASETASPFILAGDLVLRSGGSTSATLVGVFTYNESQGTAGGGIANTSGQVFGGTSITIDNTIAESLWMGLVAATSTTNTMIPQAVLWGSWN